MTRSEIEAKLIALATSDAAFRARLQTDPRAAIAEATGVELDPFVRLTVHEESADDLHLVLPVVFTGSAELSDDALDAVAGGTTSSGAGLLAGTAQLTGPCEP